MIRNMVAIPVVISQGIKSFLLVFSGRLLDVHIDVLMFPFISESLLRFVLH